MEGTVVRRVHQALRQFPFPRAEGSARGVSQRRRETPADAHRVWLRQDGVESAAGSPLRLVTRRPRPAARGPACAVVIRPGDRITDLEGYPTFFPVAVRARRFLPPFPA